MVGGMMSIVMMRMVLIDLKVLMMVIEIVVIRR